MRKNYYRLNFTHLSTLILLFQLVLISQALLAQPVLSLSASVIPSGLSQPMQLVNAGDRTNRIFIVQKGGTVLVYNSSFVLQHRCLISGLSLILILYFPFWCLPI